jgi:uncharacterized coiled-coil DUF342 family protein
MQKNSDEARLWREKSDRLRREVAELRQGAKRKKREEEEYGRIADQSQHCADRLKNDRHSILENIKRHHKRIDIYKQCIQECEEKIEILRANHRKLREQERNDMRQARDLRVDADNLRAEVIQQT